MSTRLEATIADLYHVPDNGKAEIVDGKIVLMSPTGDWPGYAAGEIFASLREYTKRTKHGRAYGDNVGFVVNLPNRRSLSPDAALYVGKPAGMKFLEGAPIFAAEVRSEGDYGERAEKVMARKRKDYFLAGTQVVWDVDLLSEDVVKAYSKADPENPVTYRRGDVARAESAISGWGVAVDDLFPPSEA